MPTTYYVRSTVGNDANNGTSAATAWATIGQAVKAAASGGIAAGDTCYVGRGNYVGAITMTTRASMTYLIGDVTGQYTGDPGDVIVNPFTPLDINSSVSNALTVTSANYWTIRNLVFEGRVYGAPVGTYLTLEDCLSQMGGRTLYGFVLVTTFGTTHVVNLTRCRCQKGGFSIYPTRGTGADYDCGIVLTNCVAIEGAATNGVLIAGTGTGNNYGGGVIVRNLTAETGSASVVVNAATVSTTFPSYVYDSVLDSVTGYCLSANTLGQLVEANVLLPGFAPRLNVAIDATSYAAQITQALVTARFPSTRRLRSVGIPAFNSPALGFGASAGAPATDINGLPRPCGTMTHGDSGTASAGGNATLSDTSKTWGTDRWKGWTCKITAGTGSGQVKQINSNTGTVLTVSGNWITNPSNDSAYTIYMGNRATTGQATAGAVGSCTDANAAWTVNQWTGWTFVVDAGTGSGDGTSYIASNTATVLTFQAARANALDNTSEYRMYRGTDENTVAPAAGAFERGDTMTREQTTVRTGGNALRAFGPATQDFDIPVAAAETAITVYARYDTTYAGTLPQIKVMNGGECGVADATDTMVEAADTWEALSLTFTPTSAGIVTLRLQSNCTATLGSAYFDDVSVV